VSPESIPGKGGSLQHVPSLVGLAIPKLLGKERWAAGFSLSRVNAWGQSSDVEREMTDLERSQSLGSQYVTGSGVSALLIESHGTAGVWHMRTTAAAQYDLTSTLRVGLLLRTPGLTIKQGGSYTHEGQLKAG
jgi:hypothetical protein